MLWLESLTVVDYVILGTLLIALAIGWARGLVDLLTGFVVFIIATVVAGRYSGEVVNWVNRMWGLRERLAAVLERRINLPTEAHQVPASSIPWHKALEWLQNVPIPEEYKQTLAQRIAEWSATAGNQTAADFIIQQLAAGVLSALIFILMTMIIGWVLAILGKLVSDQVKEIPLVGTANRFLGAVVTVGQTMVGIALIVALVAPMLSVYGMSQAGNAIANAQLTPYFLAFFGWFRGFLFGLAGAQFFSL